MQVKYQTYTMELEDTPLDLGYMSEKITLSTLDAKALDVGGHNGATQLLISLPFLNSDTIQELQKIDALLPQGGAHEVQSTLILANKPQESVEFEKIRVAIDSEGEFGDMYAFRLCGEPFDGALAKTITLISKDGALFYDEICQDLLDSFDLDKLYLKIAAAQNCYTGSGCH
jgi:peroxiredoxin